MSSWWWGQAKAKPAKPSDAANDPDLRAHFNQLLDHTEPPAVFRASDVARLLTDKQLARLGYDRCEDAIPAVYVLAWEMRAIGNCHLLKNKQILPDHVDMLDVEGPVRIMRRTDL